MQIQAQIENIRFTLQHLWAHRSFYILFSKTKNLKPNSYGTEFKLTKISQQMQAGKIEKKKN